jgi:hypothetical protein
MIALSDIKSAVNQLLTSKFGYKVYGREVVKGFARPSFFIELLPSGSDTETQNFTSNKLTVIITYFQQMSQYNNYSDIDNVNMYDTISKLFGMNLSVGTRTLHPQNIRAEYTGDNLDILQASFDLDYLDDTGRVMNTEETVASLSLKLKEV